MYSQPRYKPNGCDVDWGPLGMGPTGGAHVLCRSGHGFFISRQRQSIF
jgi:hypothetical protein